jgi:hypothetical protein
LEPVILKAVKDLTWELQKILHCFQDDNAFGVDFHINSHASMLAQKIMKLVGANSVRP